ncbi:hypothetical protein VCHC72A2_01302B, partial [Vibrio cholerae HC-72A2]
FHFLKSLSDVFPTHRSSAERILSNSLSL